MSYYTVAKVGNRWLFIDQQSKPFWMKGVFAAIYDNPDHIRAKFGGGDDWQDKWRQDTVRRMLSWGFNTNADYAHRTTWHLPKLPALGSNPVPMPYCHILKAGWGSLSNAGGFGPGPVWDLVQRADASYNDWRGGNLPDPFDPNFEPYVNGYVDNDDALWWIKAWLPKDHPEYKTPTSIGNPWCLGISMDDTDNLFGFGPGPDIPAPRLHPHIADIVRANKGSAAYAELQRIKDDDKFLYSFAKRYLSVVAAAIRRVAPGQLVFGPATLNGWGGLTRKEILKAAGEECDVVQAAISGPLAYELTSKYVGDKPIVTWDTVIAQKDSPFKDDPEASEPEETIYPGSFRVGAATQEERARMYREKMLWLASLPNVVGFKWWSWGDHRGEKRNFGLVTHLDEHAYDGHEAPYGDFLSAVKATNAEIDRIVTGDPAPPPPPPPPPKPPTLAQVMDFELSIGDSLKITGSLTLTPRRP